MSDEIIITRSQGVTNQPTSIFPTETIELPSGGKFYPPESPLSKGTVEVKMMTAKEEDILSNPNLLKKGTAVDKVLESLIVDKNVKIEDLLTGDKNAVIFSVRRLAYGDTYGPLQIKCPKCETENKININLQEIQNQDRQTEYSDVNGLFEFELPYSKVKVKVKLLTGNDEKQIESELTALQKINKQNTSEITTRLKKCIVQINNDVERKNIVNFVDTQLTSRDSLALRQFIRKITPDIDATFNFTCNSCSHEERVAVPITANFFWPDARV
jgi:phage FluMu protein Com